MHAGVLLSMSRGGPRYLSPGSAFSLAQAATVIRARVIAPFLACFPCRSQPIEGTTPTQLRRVWLAGSRSMPSHGCCRPLHWSRRQLNRGLQYCWWKTRLSHACHPGHGICLCSAVQVGCEPGHFRRGASRLDPHWTYLQLAACD
jgi:hypothetical protein